MRRPSRLAAVAAVLACALALTSACSEDGSGGDGDNGTTTADGPIEITFSDGEVSPNGKRVEATVGEPITFEITADEPGELHLHSDPEQEIPYDEGTTTEEVTIDRPGTVEVESHELDLVIVQLQVNPK